MDIESEANELYESLADDVDVDKEDIEAKLESFANYGVDADEARNAVIGKIASEQGIDRGEVLAGGDGGDGDGYPEVDIADIDEAEDWVTVEGTVDTLWDNDSDSIEQVGLIDDGTGRIKFVSWAKSGQPLLSEGQAYRLEGVVTDEYNGNYEVKLNSNSEVTMLDDVEFESSTQEQEVTGCVVGLQSGSGLVERDEDGNVVRDGDDGVEYDLRLMAVLDNGEDTYTAVIGRELTEELTGIDIDEAKDMAQEALDKSVVADEMEPEVLGKYFTVTGRVSGDWVFVDDIEQTTDYPDPEELLVKARAL